MVEPWSRCSNSEETATRVPWKHQVPPSFAGFLSTAPQRLQSIPLVYRRIHHEQFGLFNDTE